MSLSVETALRRLAEDGQRSLPPDALPDLVLACREFVRSAAPARCAVITQTIELLETAWSQFGALPVETVEQVDHALAVQLPLALDEPDEEAAVSLASSLFEPIRLTVSAV